MNLLTGTDTTCRSEWYRSFLAARTPWHPNLFADDPKPTAILRTLLPIYVTAP